MSIVLFLQMMMGWDRCVCGGGGGGSLIYNRVCVGGSGWVSSYSFCFFCAIAYCSLLFSVLLFR